MADAVTLQLQAVGRDSQTIDTARGWLLYFTYSVLDATLASDWPTGTPFHPTSGKRVLSHVTRRGTSMGAFRIGTCRTFSPEIQP